MAARSRARAAIAAASIPIERSVPSFSEVPRVAAAAAAIAAPAVPDDSTRPCCGDPMLAAARAHARLTDGWWAGADPTRGPRTLPRPASVRTSLLVPLPPPLPDAVPPPPPLAASPPALTPTADGDGAQASDCFYCGRRQDVLHARPADGAAAFTALAATSRAAFASGADTVEDKVIDWLLLALRRRRCVPARSCGILLLRGGRRRSTAKEGGGAVWRVERVERALAIRPLWHRRGAWPPQPAAAARVAARHLARPSEGSIIVFGRSVGEGRS